MNTKELSLAHDRAFIVGATLPAALLQEFRSQISQLLETGASFDTAEATLQPLLNQLQLARLEQESPGAPGAANQKAPRLPFRVSLLPGSFEAITIWQRPAPSLWQKTARRARQFVAAVQTFLRRHRS